MRPARAVAVLSLAALAMSPARAEVDVNSADEAALATIKGIGPKSAANLQAAGLTFGKSVAAPRKEAKAAAR